MNRKISVMICAAAAALSLGAKTNYVDCALSDYTGHDGTTWAKAFKTIQEAVDAAAAGDTILVHPGLYNEGGGNYKRADKDVYTGNTRVGVFDKPNLYIKSTGGKSETFIVGARADTDTGVGVGACRCVTLYNSNGTIIEGFTLTNGSTVAESPTGSGYEIECGGFYSCNTQVAVYLVDSDVRNCTARNFPATYFGTLIRCLIENNTMEAGGGNQICRNSNFYNSIITSNSGKPAGYTTYGCRMVNCTVTGNYTTEATSTFALNVPMVANNSIIECSGRVNAEGVYSNSVCVTGNPNTPFDTPAYALIAPALGDYRVRKGAAAETAGRGEDQDLFTVPDAYKYKDFNGNPIPASGTIMAGALQESVAAAGNGIHVTCGVSYDRVCVDGGKERVPRTTYFFPTNYPTMYRVKVCPPPNHYAYSISRRSAVCGNMTVYPDRDDTYCVVPDPGDGTALCTNYLSYTTLAYWADPTADAATADGSEAHPYRTLQAAVDATNVAHIIFAKPGVYDEGMGEIPAWGTKARVAIDGSTAFRLIGVEGPEKTIIMGAPDPDTLTAPSNPGCGTNALKCVIMRSQGQITGFTLTGGYGFAPDSTYTSGGAFRSPGLDFHLADCIITNNTAIKASAGMGGRLRRCYVADNKSSSNYTFDNVVLASCLLVDNENGGVNDGSLSASVQIYDSTMVCEPGVITPFAGGSAFRRANCIFDGGIATASGAPLHIAGNLFWNFTSRAANDGGIVGDPEFADRDSRDYHVSKLSPATVCGAVPTAVNFGTNWCKYAWADYDNHLRTYDADGRTVVGAFSTTRKLVYISESSILGGIAVTGAALGANDPESLGETITVAPAACTRPVAGLIVNGVTNLFEDLPGNQLAVSAAEVVAANDGYSIQVIYSNDWYVDAENGNDAALGYFPSCAKKTMAAALSNANLTAYDVVHALPGIYDTGVMLRDPGDETGTRAVVPANITLVADAGPEVTHIVGAAPTGTVEFEDSGYQMGLGAVRCVYLHDGAKVKNFTLRNGSTRADDDFADRHYHNDFSGGGVLGKMSGSRLSMVEGCVISNCAAYRGAGLRYVTAVNCRIFDNYARYNGGIAGEASLINCVADRCYSYITGGQDLYGYREIHNCTFGPHIYSSPTSSTTHTVPDAPTSPYCYIANTVFCSKATATNGVYHNCICTATTGSGCDGVTLKTLAEIGLDDDLKPIFGASALIDAGDASLIPSTMSGFAVDVTKDLAGIQRVYNGTLDVGAYEADWRPRYARDITGNTRFAVVEASTNVVETAAGTVRLNDAQTLAATWTAQTGRHTLYQLRVRVTGEGALTTYLDGEMIDVATAGEKEISFRTADGVNTLDFAFAGAGYAEILSVEDINGTVMILR